MERIVSLLFDQLAETNMRIERLTSEIEESYDQNETNQRLATTPGVACCRRQSSPMTAQDVQNLGKRFRRLIRKKPKVVAIAFAVACQQ
jgi:hypothetical protein